MPDDLRNRFRTVADLAGFGRPPEDQQQPRLRLRSWKRADKPGALIGFAGITLPYKGADLMIDDLPVLMVAGKAWATFPGKPVVIDGVVATVPSRAKPRYTNHAGATARPQSGSRAPSSISRKSPIPRPSPVGSAINDRHRTLRRNAVSEQAGKDTRAAPDGARTARRPYPQHQGPQ